MIRDVTPRGTLEGRSRASFASIEGGDAADDLHRRAGAEETMDPSMVEASLARIKALIETETEPAASR